MTNSFIPLSEPFLKFAIPTIHNESDDSIDSIDYDNLDNALDAMFPPTIYTDEDGIDWIRKISRTPATRLDAIALQNLLNDSIEHYQAHETGLCPIRRELYDKCFDEIIRQVTINCLDQGLLLFRIRNEFRMTLQAYKIVYESSVTFGLRQAIKNESNMSNMIGLKDDIVAEKASLQQRLSQLEKLHELTKGKHEELLKSVVRQYEEKVAKLKMVIKRQKKQIEVLNRKPIEL